MRGRKIGTVSGGFLMATVSGDASREIWFDTEEDFLLRAPVTEEGYILPKNYVKVYENIGPGLILDLDYIEDEPVLLRSTDVSGWLAGQAPRFGIWRIYRGGPRGLWITFEEMGVGADE